MNYAERGETAGGRAGRDLKMKILNSFNIAARLHD